MDIASEKCTRARSENNCYDAYIVYDSSEEIHSEVQIGGDCLVYNNSYFLWRPYERMDNISVMCSNASYSDITATARELENATAKNWTQGNELCLEANMYPASVSSIRNAGFGFQGKQYLWTLIMRSTSLIKKSMIVKAEQNTVFFICIRASMKRLAKMVCFKQFGFFVSLLLSLTDEVTFASSTFKIDDINTEWIKTSCKLGVPHLIFLHKSGWAVDKSLLSITHSKEVWIGYLKATFAIEYIGCLKVAETSNESLVVHTVGECYMKCRGVLFGVQTTSAGIRCWCAKQPKQLNETSCIQQCGPQDMPCGREDGNYFSLYNTTRVSKEDVVTDSSNGACLIMYSHRKYTWDECKNNKNYKILCRSGQNGETGVDVHKSEDNKEWSRVNRYCFDNRQFPATLDSIANTDFTNVDAHGHWTGVVQTHTVLQADAYEDLLTAAVNLKYAYIASNGSITFTDSGTRSSLCEDDGSFSIVPGFGVFLGIVAVLVGSFVVLSGRRGRTLCCRYKTAKISDEHVIEMESSLPYTGNTDNNETLHTYFELQKAGNMLKDDENSCKQYNPAGISKYDEVDNDFSINDGQGSQGRMQDNYNFTCSPVAVQEVSGNPDHVYNKLQIDQCGDYGHVMGPELIQFRNLAQLAVNDYNTLSCTFGTN